MPPEGNSEFEALYTEHRPAIFAFILKMVHDRDLAEDFTQETFTNIFKYFESFNPERGGFKTWAYAIARNTCLRQMARRNKLGVDGEKSSDIHLIPSGDEGPQVEIETKEVSRKIRGIIEALPEELRSIVIKKHFGKERAEDICAALNISRRTVYRRYWEALEIIRKKLTEQDLVL